MNRKWSFWVYDKEKNKLIITTKKGIAVYVGWPVMRYYAYDRENKTWNHSYPPYFWLSINTVSPLKTRKKDIKLRLRISQKVLYKIAWIEMNSSIPKDLRLLVEKYKDRDIRWHLLVLAARTDYKRVIEIMRITPSLAYMLSAPWRFRPLSHRWRFIRRIIYKKNVEILRALGFERAKSLNRVLRRIPIENVEEKLVMVLASIYKENNLDLINLLSDIPDEFLTFLNIAVIRKVYNHGTIQMARECMNSIINDGNAPWWYLALLDVIKKYDGNIKVRGKNHLWEIYNEHQRFPPPIIPEEYPVKYVGSRKELLRYSQMLNNCAHEYVYKIMGRESYIYVVDEEDTEEKAMLELNSEGKIVQLRGKNNRDVSRRIQRIVQQWLEKNALRSKNGGDIE